ncbi:endonuclease III [Candidatus Poseidoniaceae archaeon]|nr:endonuclease III [Candidatus Poseidoniaceae archaeon]|tara:strand:- start:598 stop:1248 length:651 start_codon:yes stop_codon:yes gene_type:complete
MKRSEKADLIASMLEELYPETPVPLDHTNTFELLVAVLMSAQTTDLKVNEVTPALFAKANTPQKMANLPVETILNDIRQVGLAPTKARNIRRLSELLVERHGGIIPDTFEALEALPGVGHKTAGVVLAQAFDIPAFPIDTHIHRLAARWGLSNDTTVERTEKDLKALFPKHLWNKLHLQIIFFGREYCPARRHDLTQCPICSWTATKKRIAEEARR